MKLNVAMMGLLLSGAVFADDLQKEFSAPPDSARMWTWWFWLGDKVDKESITADLEALKAQGMAGVTVYSLSGPGVNTKGPNYMSPEWRELFKHTVKEADRIGLGVSAMLCSGWNAGGPWIKPEQACKQHTCSELILPGPQHFTGRLPDPKSDKTFYRDVAVHAFPVNCATQKPPSKLMALKTMRNSVNGMAPSSEINDAVLKPLSVDDAGEAVNPAQIINLTEKLRPDGTLDWEVPAGQWKIVRIGYTLTGAKTSWSSPTGIGLESDPMDAKAMDFQFANAAAPLVEDSGKLAGKVFRSVQIDSWEINHPNWTADFCNNFKMFRGYDPTPYLSILAGNIINSPEFTDRFLYDYRKTLGDCIAENYFGRLSKLAEKSGIIQQSEAGGVFSPKIMAMDCLRNLGKCEIPMGEFWQDGTWVEANQNKNGKQTSSAGHLYGKPVIAAEAFTSFIHWPDSPASLKPTADRAFCEGFNHFFIFSSATFSGDGFPGTEFCAGTHFNRKITWWKEARCFADYIARCSHLLQQGLFVGDVLFYNGDGCPNFVPPKHVDPSLGPGYDYDVCNTEIILDRLSAKNGKILAKGGMSYRLMVLPESKTMPVEVIRKLRQLAKDGATIVGPKPEKAPGLSDYPRCDAEVKAVADELWGNDTTGIVDRKFGKGRVVKGIPIREVLGQMGVKPDFTYTGGQPDTFVDWIHRSTSKAEIYYLANRRDRTEKLSASFRVDGRIPELWDPVSGSVRELPEFEQKDGLTSLPLQFDPYGSMFVVFKKEGTKAQGHKGTQRSSNFPELKVAQEIDGLWEVSFDNKWGGPGKIEVGGPRSEVSRNGGVIFDKLISWTERPEEGIKYYSGAAVYHKAFDLQPSAIRNQKSEMFLDIGVVKVLARVKLNGKDLGTVWCSPWRIDISTAVKAGENQLEIEVINLWPNRLIGDSGLPAEKRVTSTNIGGFKKDSRLMESGLLGPVTIQTAVR